MKTDTSTMVGKRYLFRISLSLISGTVMEKTASDSHIRIKYDNGRDAWHAAYEVKVVESLPNNAFENMKDLKGKGLPE